MNTTISTDVLTETIDLLTQISDSLLANLESGIKTEQDTDVQVLKLLIATEAQSLVLRKAVKQTAILNKAKKDRIETFIIRSILDALG